MGDRAMDLLRSLIQNNVMDNLWDRHPPFQIDGNFGYTAGVGEMLLGGADGIVRVLPALPKEWTRGEFSGLVARGGITFDCCWEYGKITNLAVTAKTDVTFELRLPKGNTVDGKDQITITLNAGEKRIII